MWGGKKNMAFSNNHTLISRAAKIVGDLHFSGDLQIEGTICGNVIAEGDKDAKLVVAESGLVEGDIRTPVAVINGKVVGDIHSSRDRKSTRLNSSHVKISYAVFCLKKKKRI